MGNPVCKSISSLTLAPASTCPLNPCSGEKTLTGGRLARVKNFIKDTFCFTYGDGLANINLKELIFFISVLVPSSLSPLFLMDTFASHLSDP